ncbi:MAG: response regulator transcription factor [Chloroflexota bacterium]
MSLPALRILLVEDDPLYARLLPDLLRSLGSQVWQAGSLGEALCLAETHELDACLLDLGLPDSFGLPTFLAFQAARPELPVVICSGMDDERLAVEAVQQGAQDYLVKGPALLQGSAAGRLLARALRFAVQRSQAAQALRQERDQARQYVGLPAQGDLARGAPHARDGFTRLTPRERQVFKLIADGYTNNAIAHALGISAKTVEKHRARLMRKLDLQDMAGLVREAIRRGVVLLDP